MSLLLQLTEVIIASSQSSRFQSQVTMGERTESNITSIASDIFREREGREREEEEILNVLHHRVKTDDCYHNSVKL